MNDDRPDDQDAQYKLRVQRFALSGTERVRGNDMGEFSREMRPVTLTIVPKHVVRVLTIAITALLMCYGVTQFVKFWTGHDHMFGVLHLFDLDAENNVPTWYSSGALLLCALTLLVIGLGKRDLKDRYAAHWLALAGMLGWISMDEAASVHEMSIPLLRPLFQSSGYGGGYLWFTWVVIGAALVLVVGLSYARFLAHLPAVTRRLFVLAATLYVGGAIGVEMLGAKYAFLFGQRGYPYALLTMTEETLEMVGVVVLLYSLLTYLGMSSSGVQISIRTEEPRRLKSLTGGVSKPSQSQRSA